MRTKIQGMRAKQQDKDYCPDMVVIPAGSFMMGRPATKKGFANEVPQHTVTIAKPFAVSKFKLTFDEWDTCARYGDCRQESRILASGVDSGR